MSRRQKIYDDEPMERRINRAVRYIMKLAGVDRDAARQTAEECMKYLEEVEKKTKKMNRKDFASIDWMEVYRLSSIFKNKNEQRRLRRHLIDGAERLKKEKHAHLKLIKGDG